MTGQLLPSEQARFEEVCRFGQDKRDLLAETIALAFAQDPVWKWIYDTDQPVEYITALVLAQMLVAENSAVDEIHGFRHFGAIALWSAPEATQTEQSTALAQSRAAPYVEQFSAQLGDRVGLTGALSDAIKTKRPDESHWYLGIIGTRPDRQSQGLGTQVLQTMHDRCDRDAVPSFLISSNPQNYGFYRRHGYIEKEAFSVADSPPLLGFWRPPRQATANRLRGR